MGSFAAHFRRFALGDIFVILLVIAAALASRAMPVHRQDFSDSDPTISRPLKKETISTGLLVAIVALVCVAVLLVLGIVGWRKYGSTASAQNVRNHIFLAARALLLSLALTALLTDTIKRLVGRPRPNCLALAQYAGGVFTAPESKVNEAFQSFPSGHSSTAFSGMVFISLLLLHHLYPPGLKIRNESWRLVCALLPCLLAGYIAISRVIDLWHHPSDILAGAMLGGSISILCFNYTFARRPFRFVTSPSAAQEAASVSLLSGNTDEDDILPLVDTVHHSAPLLATTVNPLVSVRIVH